MRVVIVGAGAVGIQIARELIEERRDVVVIEKNPEIARLVDNELDCLVINADGTVPETLREAKTQNADWFIALTGSDAVNIVACGLVSAESNGTMTIARVETAFYFSLSDVQRRAFGLDYVINPAMETARSISRALEEGFAGAVVPLHEGRLQMRMLSGDGVRPFAGKTLIESRAERELPFLAVALARDGMIVVPKGDTRVEDGDRLYVLAAPAALDRLFGRVEGVSDEARRILILGATKVAERLVECLLENGPRGFFRKKADVTLMDKSSEDCKRLAREFQGISILLGDSSEEGVLEGSGIAKADLFIGATESQSRNVITALLAKRLGARKSVAITMNHRYQSLGEELDVDSIICSNDAVVSSVLATVRKAHIRTIFSFYERDVEIVELEVSPNSPTVGRSLRDMELPRDVLVAFAIRGGEVMVASGGTVLSPGDVIGLVAEKKNIAVLERIFGGSDGV
jgi:trk system potassium uptake protein